MNKIPIGKTIAYAYSFAFGSLGTIIGLVWLPLVVITVLNFLPGLAGDGPDAANLSPVARLSEGVGGLAVFLLSALLYAVIYTVVTRQALGLRQGGATVHFALGMPEFRMFGAVLTLIAVTFMLLTVYGGVLLLLPSTAAMLVALGEVAFALIVGLGLLYILIRLSFLLVPVTVAEEQISLVRGWMLTNGNFWQALAVILAVAVPIIVAFGIGAVALMAKDLFAPLPAATMNNQVLLVQHMSGIFRKYGPELVGLQLILAPFSLGLNLGAAAYAYRSIVQTIPAPKNA